MLFGQNMIKEYTFLPRSFAAAQSLQNLDFEGSRTTLRLIIAITPNNTSTYKQNKINKINQYTNQ